MKVKCHPNRSGSVQRSADKEENNKNQNKDSSKMNSKEDHNNQTSINDSNQIEKNDQKVTAENDVSKVKILRPESPFHRNCRPKEPNRDFVAKPIPPNLLSTVLLSTGAPIKTRVNGELFIITYTFIDRFWLKNPLNFK